MSALTPTDLLKIIDYDLTTVETRDSAIPIWIVDSDHGTLCAHIDSEFGVITLLTIADKNSDNKYYYGDGENLNDDDFIGLEVRKDVLDKAEAIYKGTEYDEGIMIEFECDKDTLHIALLAAHEKNVTFNEYVVGLLTDMIEREKKEKHENDSDD